MSRLFLVVAAATAVTTSAPANPVTYDKLAYLTFSAPVQVPGATLTAGTYRFRLTNPSTSRNVLQVLSHDGATVYAMFHTIPDSRTALTEDPMVTFMETPAGVPAAVRTLFYGGEYRGYEFVYPKGGPIMIEAIPPQPAITYSVPAAAPMVEPEPVVEESAREPMPEPVIEAPYEALPEQQAAELPRTASPVPWVPVGGVMSMLLGLGLGLLRRHAG